ncbi:MAG TPA: hypothetical protein VFW23_11595 [Tepidisphaeraceae bacterium]|nr:hypothetical protein [Tepidisphaeraceae bacterium]
MKTVIALAAIAAFSMGGLIGCQNDDARSTSNNTAATSSPYSTSSTTSRGGESAGVPDPTQQTNIDHYGSGNGKSGTLSGGTAADPNANTPGGGQ